MAEAERIPAQRVMDSGDQSNNDSNLLVKAEWDAAETWFTDNVDSLPPPP